jgi:hypothetical protein
MTNEWKEFKAYTEKPIYISAGKRDTTYLGRFTFVTLTTFEGLGRILTILARGYLFHDKGGNLVSGNPYDRIDNARNALCAWCSIPDKTKNVPDKNLGPAVDFRNLSADFPELVNDKVEGWLYRHVGGVIRFTRKNPTLVSKSAMGSCDILSEKFNREWKKKVRQLQVPIFALNTKGAWVMRFDDIIADALNLGALRNTEITFTSEELEQLKAATPKGVPNEVIPMLIAYYRVNKIEESDWVLLPVSSFDAYFGSTGFSKKWLNQISGEIVERQKQSFGVCRYRIKSF